MTKTEQDFTIREGDTVRIEDTVEGDDGSARDLTDHEINFVLARYNGAEPAVELSGRDNEVGIPDASSGLLTIDLEPSDTEGLADDSTAEYYYEVELTDPTDDVHTVTVGTITVEPSY